MIRPAVADRETLSPPMTASRQSYRYNIVDVFTRQPLEGNALAVFPDASGMDDDTMQKIARETNLSETTFVFPATRADCVACVRIFTPRNEMRFAGHPTLGTSFVLLEEGIVAEGTEQFLLEERVGPIPVRVDAGESPMLWLRTPAIQYGRCYDRQACAEALGLSVEDLLEIAPQFVSAGNPTIFIATRDRNAVDRASIDVARSVALRGSNPEPLCFFIFAPTPEGAYSRMFAPDYGVFEDPATGSSTGPLASFMMRHGLVARAAGTRFHSEQGTKMGRRSILHVVIHGKDGVDGIDVGGYVTPVATGRLTV
jgi:trans-2,3-dihydro-3-hydroxyanthranilate isomerase